MTVTYSPAPEVEAIAKKLIRDVADHKMLDQFQIEYVFRSEAANENGKAVLGKTRKVSGLNAFLMAGYRDGGAPDPEDDNAFFVIEIAADCWADLTTSQRIALVDHELCHCGWKEGDDGLVLQMRPHDLEEFHAVVDRRGLWQRDVEVFVKVANRQLSLLAGEAS